MADHVYKQLELVGSSTRGIEDAVQRALAKAAKTVRNIHWFQIDARQRRKRQGGALAGHHEGRLYARGLTARVPAGWKEQ